jgi:hypothetical protein
MHRGVLVAFGLVWTGLVLFVAAHVLGWPGSCLGLDPAGIAACHAAYRHVTFGVLASPAAWAVIIFAGWAGPLGVRILLRRRAG